MGNPIDDFTQQKLAQFKQQIVYDRVIANLGPDKTYIVDWESILGAFIDVDGVEWKAEGEPEYYVFGILGTTSIALSNGQEEISVEIRKGGDKLRSTVDSMLRIAASGSAPRVGMQAMTRGCPGDFCLINGDAVAPYGLYMAKGNILVKLKCDDEGTVLPVARYIADQMDKRNLDPRQSPLNKLSLQLKTDRYTIRQGEDFAFTVEPKSLFGDPEWLTDVRPANGEDLKYVNEEPGRYTYKALKIGAAKITVAVMHKRTLQVKEETFVVNVN